MSLLKFIGASIAQSVKKTDYVELNTRKDQELDRLGLSAIKDNVTLFGITELLRLEKLGVKFKTMAFTSIPAYVAKEEGHVCMYFGSVDLFTNMKSGTLGKSQMDHLIIHEGVHVDQILRGDLTVDLDANTIIWKGEVFQTGESEFDYYMSPWEIEAYQKQFELQAKDPSFPINSVDKLWQAQLATLPKDKRNLVMDEVAKMQ